MSGKSRLVLPSGAGFLVNYPRHFHIRSVDSQHLTGKNQVSVTDAVNLLEMLPRRTVSSGNARERITGTYRISARLVPTAKLLVDDSLHGIVAIAKRTLAILAIAVLLGDHFVGKLIIGLASERVDRRRCRSSRAGSTRVLAPSRRVTVEFIKVEITRPAGKPPGRRILSNRTRICPFIPRLILITRRAHIGVLRDPQPAIMTLGDSSRRSIGGSLHVDKRLDTGTLDNTRDKRIKVCVVTPRAVGTALPIDAQDTPAKITTDIVHIVIGFRYSAGAVHVMIRAPILAMLSALLHGAIAIRIDVPNAFRCLDDNEIARDYAKIDTCLVRRDINSS
nr:MAG TPA: hypothetical protein [Caudoviricetes sp.]